MKYYIQKETSIIGNTICAIKINPNAKVKALKKQIYKKIEGKIKIIESLAKMPDLAQYTEVTEVEFLKWEDNGK